VSVPVRVGVPVHVGWAMAAGGSWRLASRLRVRRRPDGSPTVA